MDSCDRLEPRSQPPLRTGAWLVTLGLILSTTSSSRAQAGPKVILAVIVDDLGWADVGFHRDPPSPEIQTPALDALVADGIELTRHYAHCTCTPSRSSFFSGRLPMHVQQTLSNPEDPTMGVPRNMTVIAAKMRQAGYKTHVVGKYVVWRMLGLGRCRPELSPPSSRR